MIHESAIMDHALCRDKAQRAPPGDGQAGFPEDQFGQPQRDQFLLVPPGNAPPGDAPPQRADTHQLEGFALRRRKPAGQFRCLAHLEAFPDCPAARAGSFPGTAPCMVIRMAGLFEMHRGARHRDDPCAARERA